VGILGIGPGELLIGVAMAIIAGYIAIKLVSKTVASKRFYCFAFYTRLLGTALIDLH
jgi:undecaprenyl pyrophosphate phosphatase UppP